MDKTTYIKKTALKIFGIELGSVTTSYVEQFDDNATTVPIIISKQYHDDEFDIDKKGNNGDATT